MDIKNGLAILLFAMFICFIPKISYAELSDVEKEVIWYVNMCEQQASIGEHTEGMSKDNMNLFTSECEKMIAQTYRISRDDTRYLLLNKKNNTPLPDEYKKPTMPTEDEKTQLNNEIKQLMRHYEELDAADKQAFEMRKKHGVGQ